MTQDEIKEALETCILGYCTGCPYDGCDGDCRDELHKDVLTLITEQEKSIQMAQDQILFVAQQNQEYREQQVKQAKIDMLNKAKERLDSAPNGWAYTGYIDDLIEEVQNGKIY